jgi:hypothetical protein
MSSGAGGMDIRLPIGLLFSLIGVLIAVYGAVTSGNEMYSKHSLGININLWWGLVLTAFGVFMLGLAWRAAKSGPKAGQP